MWNVVRDLRDEYLCGHAGQGGGAAADRLGPALEFALFQGVIFLQVGLHGREHADYFFLVHLHAAADRIAIRRRIEAGRRDEILSTEEQAGALRSPEALAAGERHEVESHL